MRSLLVTGGAGFIGANFVHYWLSEHPSDRIVVLDALTYAGNICNLADVRECTNLAFVRGDICDADLVEKVLQTHAVDTIVHFAAESHVDRSIAAPDAFIKTNVTGTHTLLKAARGLWESTPEFLGRTRRFHHVSTDEVYGSLGVGDAAFSESTPYSPNSPYAASKAAADHLVRAYHRTFGLPVTISNCSNNYGAYHFPEKLIPLALTRALSGGMIPIYGDGLNIRDWLHVDDHCRAIDMILRSGREGRSYNIGGNNERTNLEVITLLCDELDLCFANDPELRAKYPDAPAAHGTRTRSLMQFVDDRAGHDRRYAINAARISRELGFAPRWTFERGLAATLAWYLDHESWWRGVLDGSYKAVGW